MTGRKGRPPGSFFVSYSHEDRGVALRVESALAERGATCWRDDACLRTGDEFAPEITRAIRESDALVLLLSKSSNVRDFVRKEVYIAHHFRRPILPVFLEPVEVSDALLPYVVGLHRWELWRVGPAGLAESLGVGPGDAHPNAPASPSMTVGMPSPPPAGAPQLVTVAEYAQFLEESERLGSRDVMMPKAKAASISRSAPVTCVSWSDAEAFCDWNGGRLPVADRSSARDTASRSGSDDRILEWRDGGSDQHKQVCESETGAVLAVMDKHSRQRNVGFRCVPSCDAVAGTWVRIAGGEFLVGAEAAAFARLSETYRVPRALTRSVVGRRSAPRTLREFAIRSTCVTNDQYYEFTRSSGRPWPTHWDSCWLDRHRRPFPPRVSQQPVVNVSAAQAQAYCIWSRTRLPSWVEWERAVAGEVGFCYPWGSDYSRDRCNSVEGERGSLAAVDEFPEGDSAEGVRQLCGNVAEWAMGPRGVPERRGGSWRVPCEIWGLKYAFEELEADSRAPDLGFRVVSDDVGRSGTLSESTGGGR